MGEGDVMVTGQGRVTGDLDSIPVSVIASYSNCPIAGLISDQKKSSKEMLYAMLWSSLSPVGMTAKRGASCSNVLCGEGPVPLGTGLRSPTHFI